MSASVGDSFIIINNDGADAVAGTFAGLKTVRFNHTHTGNRIDKALLGLRVVPTAEGPALAWNGVF